MLDKLSEKDSRIYVQKPLFTASWFKRAIFMAMLFATLFIGPWAALGDEGGSKPNPPRVVANGGLPNADLKTASSDFKAFRSLAQQIYELYPPSEYIYVGIGRSPTPLIAMMKASFGDTQAVNLPLTGMVTFAENPKEKDAFGERISNSYISFDQDHDIYTPLAHRKLRQHLDAFMPNAQQISGRKILLIDALGTGESLINSKHEIKEYYSEKKLAVGVQVEALGIMMHPQQLGTKRHPEYSVKSPEYATILVPRRLRNRFIQRWYRGFAEYEQFFPGAKTDEYHPPERRTESIIREGVRVANDRHAKSFGHEPTISEVRNERNAHLDSYRILTFDDLLALFRKKTIHDQSFVKYLSTRFPRYFLQPKAEELEAPTQWSCLIGALLKTLRVQKSR